MINEQLTIGLVVNVVTMLVHLAATLLLVALIHPYGNWLRNRPRIRLVIALLVTNYVLLTAHLLEVGLWALIYTWLELVDNPSDAFYSAFVNYTTLGYGDVLQGTSTRLLGPLASASGIMMFGWSTALLIYVLQGHLPNIIIRRDPKS
ncbi:potassium channel family protein [Ancylobacter sp. A5.8]|uniref:potassium channel family protein n=1 Tax=Ancylobacter gelatini TaxID=2919920 RepID=UPI001F4D7E75|nr:potassium channel family protein [Ancylobacter gelatini]MCJ8144796.1 potassium channel family protein [Ancylobacter gelatini]